MITLPKLFLAASVFALISFCLKPGAIADGYYNLLNGQSNQPYQLAFVGSAFSSYTWSCVLVNVERLDRVGRPSNWPSATVVTLSGTDATTYSDSTCDTAISSVTINSGSTSASFYVLFSTSGSLPLTATNGSLVTGTQTETITLDPFTWIGGASCSPANWATGACWQGGAAPGTSGRAIFDGNCTTNCSPTIAANIDVGGVALEPTYTGVVTQASGMTVTIESGGSFPHNFYISAGSFFGGNSAITDNGDFKFIGGALTSTTAIFEVATSFSVSGSPTFNNSNGTVQFGSGASWNGGGTIQRHC